MNRTSDERVVREAAEIVARGGVIAFRTDTFYGLGADPFNRVAIQRIKTLKGREEGKPILIVISDRDKVKRFIRERSSVFDLLAGEFWPGPLTLIGKAAAGVPGEITADTGTIGVRLPDDEKVRALVRACGGALTATSANPSGLASAGTSKEVGAFFPGIDLIVDGGDVTASLPSTILDLSLPAPRIIREGAIARAEIELALSACEIQQLHYR